jgi:hypothetical protein
MASSYGFERAVSIPRRRNVSKEHLGTYLNDHLAGSHTAVETVNRLLEDAPDLSAALAQLKTEIEEDREQLRALMQALGVTESVVRKAGGWLAERATSVKLGIDDKAKGPLRRLERLELLSLGIEGKIGMWRALQAVAAADSAFQILDYAQLTERGRDQRARVEALRLEAGHLALAA